MVNMLGYNILVSVVQSIVSLTNYMPTTFPNVQCTVVVFLFHICPAKVTAY